MISQNIFFPVNTKEFQPQLLEKGTWLTILHAQHVPPHVGIMFAGNYNSLTIKEAELNVSNEVLLKTVIQKKIKTIFLKVAEHPVFSIDHQKDVFQEDLKKLGYVKQNQATCLSPIKSFFHEFYLIQSSANELLFDFIQQLNSNKYLDYACGINMELNDGIELPFYTVDDLNEKIKTERQIYYND